MIITFRRPLTRGERFADDICNVLIGRAVTVNWSGGPSKATITAAEIVDDGHAIELALLVPHEMEALLLEHLTPENAYSIIQADE